MESREITTLSASALGSLIGGLLASPLGPWAAVGGATIGTTLGGYFGNQLWQQFYLDMGAKLAEARRLLEQERASEAAALLIELRQHPRFAEQEQNFRSEIEYTAGRVLAGLAERAEIANDPRGALEHFRQARLFQPLDPVFLWNVIRLGVSTGDPAYEDSARLRDDLKLLLAIDARHAGAARALAELHERLGELQEAARVLRAAAAEAADRASLREELLRWALRLDPRDGGSIAELARLLLESNRPREALDLLEAKADLFEQRDLHTRLTGKALHATGNHGPAKDLLESLAGEDPESRLLAGLSAIHTGETDAAIRLLSGSTSDPQHGREATLALVPLLLDRGELDLARNHLEREGLAEMPGYEALLKRLAAAYEARGLEEKAARVFDLMRDLGDASSFWARFGLQYRDGSPIVLGRGSAGRVLLGKRRTDSLPVAIREAPAPFALGGKAARRFAREVELLESLSHPHLVSLLGHALPEGKCLLAMEHCAGGSLAERLGAPPLWAQTKHIFEGVTAALVFLQEQETPLVHRNVKPSNILFTAEGVVKLSDFSLTRPAEAPGTSVVTSIKERAQLYLYQSPEVILGQAEVGATADVYSLGCVLYHLLTGQPPFFHADVNRQISAHFQDTPKAPSALAAWVPKALDEAVLRCLEKEPARRYSDVRQMWAALEPI